MERFAATQANELLAALGEVLADRGEHHELVVIGGTALILSGLSSRTTKDVDVLARVDHGQLVSADPLPEAVVVAASSVAGVYDLPSDWLNSDPASQLADGLPDGFETRLERREYGGLVVLLPSRADQIALKVHAAADPSLPNKHLEDLQKIEISTAELEGASAFAVSQRARRDPRQRVARVVEDLRSR
jgi:hypothetical protein